MSDAWFPACLSEIQAFLDKFENQKTATVRDDSDLVAALVGILEGSAHVYLMGKHVEAAMRQALALEQDPQKGGR